MKLRPLRAPQRPFALLAQLDLVGKGATQVEPDARLALPAVPLALQVMVEEALLKLHAVIEVEPFLVAAGMAVEPLFLRRSMGEGVEIAPRALGRAHHGTPVTNAQLV